MESANDDLSTDEQLLLMRDEFRLKLLQSNLLYNIGNRTQLFTIPEYNRYIAETIAAKNKNEEEIMSMTDRRRINKYSVLTVLNN